MKRKNSCPSLVALFTLLIFVAACADDSVKPPMTITYQAFSEGTPDGYECNAYAYFQCDGVWFYGGWCVRGFNVCVINYESGKIINKGVDFDTWISDYNKTKLLAFLDSVPDGRMIMVAVCDEAGFSFNHKLQIDEDVRAYFEKMGSLKIRDYVYRDSWAFIAIKGKGKALDEAFAKYGEPVSAKTTLIIKR